MKTLLIIITLILVENSFAQTNSSGNYEGYSYETSRNGIGYLSMDINFPEEVYGRTFNQQGAIYTYQYFMGEIGAYNITNNFRLRFITEGNFNIGAALGTTKLKHYIADIIYEEEIKIYTAKLDVYSFDIGTEFTYVFDDGLALTAKLGMNIFSIGASVAFPEEGRINDDLIGDVNIMPLIIKPQFLIDFGRSVLGIGFSIHPKNFIEYKYVPTPLFDSKNKGIIYNDDFMTDFAVQLLFHY